MANEKKPYFCNYNCCKEFFLTNNPYSKDGVYLSGGSINYSVFISHLDGANSRILTGDDVRERGKKKLKEIFTFPLVNEEGENYTPHDNWAYWLGKMNTYWFEDISFRERDTGYTIRKVFPDGPSGVFVVNAFTLAQARNILVSNIKHYGNKTVDEGPNPNICDIKYKIAESYLGYKGYKEYCGKGIPSDCDPAFWGRENYFIAVSRKLAYERGLIAKGYEDYFANYRNAVEDLQR